MDVVRRLREALVIFPGSSDRGAQDPDAGDRTTQSYVPVQAGFGGGGRGPSGAPGRRGWTFAAIWLAYLAPTISDAWKVDGLARRLLGVAIVLVFAVLYVFTFLIVRKLRWMAEGVLSRRDQALVLSSLLGLTLAGCFVIGQAAMAMLVYIAVSAVLVLPVGEAWIMVLLLIGANETSSRTVSGWQPDDQLSFSIFLAALAIWGVTQVISRNRQLAVAHDEIARLAVTAERTRFARDMHDLLGHSLTVMTVKAELAGRLVPIDPGRAEQEINDVEQLARDALADVRAAVAGYREMSLAAEIVSARTALDAAGIEAELPGAVDDVPGDRRELFGWALREGVTNIVRHSGATHCRVALSPAAIEIVDDGRGPALVADDHGGSGLTGLRERAEAAGAAITVGRSGPDGGFCLRVGW